MTKAWLKNLLLLLEFLIYLQSAQSSDDESDGRNHYKLNHHNNLANLINKNNNSTCREGFLYNGTSGNCTLILPTRFPLNTTTSSTSSTTTAVHIETLELVQTVLLIALPLITILCLFFFCDRLGRYVQKMHHQDVEISFDGEDGGHHPQSLNLYHPHHVNSLTNSSSTVSSVDLPPPYNSVTEQQQKQQPFSHVQYLQKKSTTVH